MEKVIISGQVCEFEGCNSEATEVVHVDMHVCVPCLQYVAGGAGVVHSFNSLTTSLEVSNRAIAILQQKIETQSFSRKMLVTNLLSFLDKGLFTEAVKFLEREARDIEMVIGDGGINGKEKR